SPASTLTINNRMDITNQLTLTSGRIVTGTHEVRVTNPATGAVTPGNANSYVQGRLRRFIGGVGAYDFPVGTGSYQRANVDFMAAPGVHNLLAWFNDWPGIPPTPPNPTAECGAQYHTCPMLNNGYWTINAFDNSFNQITTSGTYTMTLYNTAFTTCPGAAQFGVLKNNGSGWFIQNPGCHANANAATVQRPGMSGFSDFGTGQSVQPLPVYFTLWDGYVRADEAHVLRWDILTEGQRVSRFVIETGSSPEELRPWRTFSADTREAVRENPPVGVSLYRLRVHLEDGSEVQSSVLELRRAAPEAGLKHLEAFPNPTTGELTVRFMVSSAEPVSLSLWNALGQVVMERRVEPSERGWVETRLYLGELPAGPYLLRVMQGGELHTKLIQRQ
ncbi:MAG: T9SS type A sorting domain-containing protein, partial [Bacteroidia bacterium]|nr:T9SS type A sorting domain-containing protein [Bacteroidia bacterium]